MAEKKPTVAELLALMRLQTMRSSYPTWMYSPDSGDTDMPKAIKTEVESCPPVKSKAGELAVEFEEGISKRIIGQPEAINSVVRAYKTYLTKMWHPGHPISNLLFLGQTGVGKTKVVETCAEVLFGDSKALLKIDCAEYQHSHEVAKLIGCFIPGTKVLMSDGSRKSIETINKGSAIICKDGLTRKTIDAYTYQYTGEIFSINIAGSYEPICVTPNHEIWAIRGRGKKRPTTVAGRNRASLYDSSKLEFIAAGDLHEGDIVTYPRFRRDETKYKPVIDLADYLVAADHPNLRITPKTIDSPVSSIKRFIKVADFARIAGYYVSEGGLNSGETGINITFGLSPSKLSAWQDLEQMITPVLGNASRTTQNRESSNRVYVFSVVLAEFFKQEFGSMPEKKHIPNFILHAPDSVVWNFLDAALLGDGGRTVTRRVDYSTVSETLASQMELLIRSLGFASQMQRHKAARSNWQIRYRLYVSGDQIARFVKNLPLFGPYIDLTNTGNSGIQREYFVDKNYIYFRVRTIEKFVYSGPVHDISVAGEQSYVVAASVHNSPPGYIGHRETPPYLNQDSVNHWQTDKNKLTLLLFDEIEKANEALWQLMLSILDKAALTLGDSRKVDFSNCIIFMTSNLGARDMTRIVGDRMGFAPRTLNADIDTKLSSIALAAAKRNFTPEFMNRIDNTVVFHSLQPEHLTKIVHLELRAVQERILGANCPTFILEWTPAAVDFLIQHGTSREYGAREIKRAIEKHVVQPLTDILLGPGVDNADTLTLDVINGAIYFAYTAR